MSLVENVGVGQKLDGLLATWKELARDSQELKPVV